MIVCQLSSDLIPYFLDQGSVYTNNEATKTEDDNPETVNDEEEDHNSVGQAIAQPQPLKQSIQSCYSIITPTNLRYEEDGEQAVINMDMDIAKQ